jgi:hypothetical protein
MMINGTEQMEQLEEYAKHCQPEKERQLQLQEKRKVVPDRKIILCQTAHFS